jgi:uncharacterized protein YukE
MATTMINVQAVTDSINDAIKMLSEQEEALGKINNTVDSMNGVWEAEDQRVYSEQFQNTKNKIETFNNSVKDTLQAMQTYVNDCVVADEQTARDLRNISW